jgi:hypothetical protein
VFDGITPNLNDVLCVFDGINPNPNGALLLIRDELLLWSLAGARGISHLLALVPSAT